MSNSERKGEEEMNKGEKVKQFFIDKKKEMNTKEGWEQFERRLNRFHSVVEDYVSSPTEFIIFADAFMSFFEIDQDESQDWLSTGIEVKLGMMEYKFKEGEFLNIDAMFDRVVSFADILFHTGYGLGMPVYISAANRLLYVLTGSMPVLNGIESALYIFPKEEDEKVEVEDSLIPEDEHEERLYQ